MSKACVFRKNTDSNVNFNIVNKYRLKKLLENKRTSIYSNEEMRVSIDKSVVRVLIFDENNIKLLENLRGYFYGNDYE